MSLFLDVMFWSVNVGLFIAAALTVWHNLKQ